MGDHNRLKDSGFASIGEILDAIGVEDSSQAAVGQAVTNWPCSAYTPRKAG